MFQVFHLEVRIAYLKQYPKGSFSQLVQARIAASKREQVAVARLPAAVKPRKADALLVVWTPYLPSLATSPFWDTTFPGRQVGEGVSPILDEQMSWYGFYHEASGTGLVIMSGVRG